MPLTTGSFTSTLEAATGSYEKTVVLDIRDYSAWRFSSGVTFPVTPELPRFRFSVYLELNDSLSGFSYEQFASPFGYDLRFVSNTTNEEIEYEIVKWDPAGQSSFWLKLPELNASTSIKALWGNQNALVQPGYSEGRSDLVQVQASGIWTERRMIWSKKSSSSFHAIPYNFETLRAPESSAPAT